MFGTCDGVCDAAGEVDMVVFEEYHVEESDAVVGAAANADGFLFKKSKARCGLAGVKNSCVCPSKQFDVAMGGGGDATHSLHDVEHESFGLEEGEDSSFNKESDVTFFDGLAVMDEDGDFEFGVEGVEDFFGDLDAGKDAVFFDDELLFAHGVRGDAGEGGMVSVTDVFGEPIFDL